MVSRLTPSLPSAFSRASSRRSGSLGAGAHVGGFLLASAPVVSRSSDGCPGVPSTLEGSTQTAPLPLSSPEPPRASSDCVSYIERSARSFGFSSAVARQLARCRRSSARVNYQAKWAVYRAWCARHGHSVSRPSVPKIASFLLYLRHSLSLSYSSLASYRSMLSVVFRFILPELSSHFVLRDLLRSFRLERPISLSRVPPWDLSLVLSFLRGPPFEPLSSCSLRDLTRKVLFLLSLATAHRVGELQSLSSQVSSSGEDFFFFLTYQSSGQRPSLRFALFLIPFLSGLFMTTLALLWMSCFCVRFALFASICLGLLLFSLVLARFFSLLMLLLALSL